VEVKCRTKRRLGAEVECGTCLVVAVGATVNQRRARVEEIAEDRVVVMFGDDLAVTAALNSRHDFRNIQIDPVAS
jgi:hypothetical protein